MPIDTGGRGLGDWYSTDTEMKMGKQYAMMVEQTARMVQDPVVNEYVNRIGQNLVRNSDAKVPFTIKVIDSDEINAFALPGGFFYVNSGLILHADEESIDAVVDDFIGIDIRADPVFGVGQAVGVGRDGRVLA